MSPTTLTVHIPGVPAPQGSVKAYRVGDQVRTTHANPGKLAPWRNRVVDALVNEATRTNWAAASIATVDLTFTMPRPKSHPKWKQQAWPWHTTRPDLDKLTRAVLDALTIAQAVADDAHVWSIHATKRYGTPTGLHLTVHATPEPAR